MMEQTVKIRYWRRPWLNACIFFMLNIFALAYKLYKIYTDSVKYGHSYYLKPETVILVAIWLVGIVCCFLYIMSVSVRTIAVSGDKVLFRRAIGRTIAIGVQKVVIYSNRDVLSIGNRFSIRLNNIVNKEQVKDLLSGHVRVLPKDTRALYYIARFFAGILLTAAMLLIVLLFINPEQMVSGNMMQVYVWLLGGLTLGFLAWTIWNLAAK